MSEVPTRPQHSYTDEVCRYIVSPIVLDDEARSKVKEHLLDTLACAIAAGDSRPAEAMRNAISSLGDGGRSVLWGTGQLLPPDRAAMMNAQQANLLDFDDTAEGGGHPGAVVIPSAIAAGEHVDATGKALLESILVGYEIAERLGRYVRYSGQRAAQVWGQTSWQGIGAAAGAARISGLNFEQTKNAIGIAAQVTPVPASRKSGMAKSDPHMSWIKNGYGWSAANAVLASLLAHQGFVANHSFLDGPTGLWVMAGGDDYDEEQLIRNLGSSQPTIMRASIKPYASCRWSHSTLDAVSELTQAGMTPEEVESIDIFGFRELDETLNGATPTNIIDAQFHLGHLVALQLLGRSPQFGLRERDLDASEVRALSARVRIHVDDVREEEFRRSRKTGVRVVLKTRSGGSRTVDVEHPWGSPEGKPFTHSETVDKAMSLMARTIGIDAATRVCEAVQRLEEVRVRDLAALLSASIRSK